MMGADGAHCDTEVVMDTKTASPASIDAEIARLAQEADKINQTISRMQEDLARAEQDSYWALVIGVDKVAAELAQARTHWYQAMNDITPLHAEFESRGGWTRYYLVDSYDGHVHRDADRYRCSRTRATVHIWLTEQSGMPAAELVELAGERACTLCFPDAPVDVLRRPSVFTPPTAVEKEARAVERRERARVKAEKAITNPDGSRLVVTWRGSRETPATLIAAQRLALDIEFWSLASLGGNGKLNDEERAALDVLFTAIAAKTRADIGCVKTDHEVRLIKKCRREGVTR